MLHKTIIRLVILIILCFTTLVAVVGAKKCKQQITTENQKCTSPASGDYLIWDRLATGL